MAISPLKFYNLLKEYNIDFFTGVPDSLLKHLCLCIDDNVTPEQHIIAANEGNAIALAAGYHLGTGKLPLVYMQNSGLGNAINPLLSLCDPEVYSIPMIILLGWRGEPDVYDEPQHIKQGKVQMDLLKDMGISYAVISDKEEKLEEKIRNGVSEANENSAPFVFVIRKNVFEKYKSSLIINCENLMTREESLEIVLNKLPSESILVSTTGKTSREIFEIREKNNEIHSRDFLTVGSMGHCSSIALGISLACPNRKVFCIDGDGSLIMHMGNLSIIGKLSPPNFFHILINNGVHESVGGQRTSINFIDVQSLVKANGYKHVYTINNSIQLTKLLSGLFNKQGPVFIEIKTKPGSRNDLGRPTINPIDNKKDFMKFLQINTLNDQ